MYGTFLIIYRTLLLRTRNFSGISCRENQNTHFMLTIFFSESRAVCNITWKNTIQPDEVIDGSIIGRRKCDLRAG
jgi:hypothetical protein